MSTLYNHLPVSCRKLGGGPIMKMLSKEDVKTLTADQKLELMDLLSESLEEDQIPLSPEVRDEVDGFLNRRLLSFGFKRRNVHHYRFSLSG
jgi:hypothetical protein